MASIPLSLHLEAEDRPLLDATFKGSTGPILASVIVPLRQARFDHQGLNILAEPRDLRRWAQALLDVADEACRQEDRLTDEPLPGIAS